MMQYTPLMTHMIRPKMNVVLKNVYDNAFPTIAAAEIVPWLCASPIVRYGC